MPLNDVFQVSFINRTSTNQNMINVVAYRITQIVGVEPTVQDIADRLSAQYATMIKPLLSDGNAVTPDVYAGLRIRQVLPVVTANIVSLVSAGIGVRSGAACPPAVTLPLTNRAASAPPHVRGRTYPPRPCVTDVSDTGRPTAGYRTDLLTFGAFLVADQVVNPVAGTQCTVTPVIYSRKNTQAYTITQSIREADFGNQRRRSNINRDDALLI